MATSTIRFAFIYSERTLHFYNAINNSKCVNLFAISYSTAQVFNVRNSYLLNNDISKVLAIDNSSPIDIHYFDCKFSSDSKSIDSSLVNNCDFSFTDVTIQNAYIQCYYRKRVSFVVRKKHLSNLYFCIQMIIS